MVVGPHASLFLGGREIWPAALTDRNHRFDLLPFPVLAQKGEGPLSSLNLLVPILA